jgi:hypothetical protein
MHPQTSAFTLRIDLQSPFEIRHTGARAANCSQNQPGFFQIWGKGGGNLSTTAGSLAIPLADSLLGI